MALRWEVKARTPDSNLGVVYYDLSVYDDTDPTHESLMGKRFISPMSMTKPEQIASIRSQLADFKKAYTGVGQLNVGDGGAV